MWYRITLGAAASIFFAFLGLSPESLHHSDSDLAPHSLVTPTELSVDFPELDPAASKASDLDPNQLLIESAIDAFAPSVTNQSHPEALRYAFRAYYAYRAANPEQVRNPYFYYVDFGLDSRTPRGYVFDMDAKRVIEGPFHVAHGQGSAPGNALLPTRFLNTNGSNATSLGLYLAQETYGFRGRSGGQSYRSIGLRLRGLSGSFNSAARSRGIVVHGAPYVTNDRAGRSQGCPAMRPDLAERLIPMIANGGLVFHFSPADARWMREDPWARELPGLASR